MKSGRIEEEIEIGCLLMQCTYNLGLYCLYASSIYPRSEAASSYISNVEPRDNLR